MIIVLRVGHRIFRDDRITTHCGLVARAFGADKIVICGDEDLKCVDSINKVSAQWGGEFSAEYVKKWEKMLRSAKENGDLIVHLTMYGITVNSIKKEIKDNIKKGGGKGSRNLWIIIGSQKVPKEAYELADYNVAVGNTPHSEISALAIFMYEVLGKKMVDREFKGKVHVEGSVDGKKIIKK
jgi:tRNA (cytidine56-2'-O)-methyltransferase